MSARFILGALIAVLALVTAGFYQGLLRGDVFYWSYMRTAHRLSGMHGDGTAFRRDILDRMVPWREVDGEHDGTRVRTYYFPLHSRDNAIVDVRLFSPGVLDGLPAVIVLHEGGFVSGSNAWRLFDSFCRWLAAETKSMVVAPNYSLAPEGGFPHNVHDVIDLMTWIATKGPGMQRFDRSRIAIVGFEAGASVGLSTLLLTLQGEGLPVHAAALVSPVFDPTKYALDTTNTYSEATLQFIANTFKTQQQRHHREPHQTQALIDPSRAQNDQLARLPPMLLLQTQTPYPRQGEDLFARISALRTTENARKQDSVFLYPQALPGFLLNPGFSGDDSNDAREALAQFLNTALKWDPSKTQEAPIKLPDDYRTGFQ